MTGLPRDLDQELHDFFAMRLESQPARPQVRPIVCVDECLNHPALAASIEEIHKRRVIQYATAAWYEIHVQPNGSHAYASSFPLMPGEAARLFPGFSSPATRVPQSRWPDVQVMWHVIAEFQVADTVFFLSANRLDDPEGIKVLLDKKVAPLLTQFHRERFSLSVLWKRAKTDVPTFGECAASFIAEWTPTPGYHVKFL